MSDTGIRNKMISMYQNISEINTHPSNYFQSLSSLQKRIGIHQMSQCIIMCCYVLIHLINKKVLQYL